MDQRVLEVVVVEQGEEAAAPADPYFCYCTTGCPDCGRPYVPPPTSQTPARPTLGFIPLDHMRLGHG